MLSVYTYSERGQTHEVMGKPNEDAYATFQNDTLAVIAICDGAGGLPAGKRAAEIASNTLLKECSENFFELYSMSGDRAIHRVALLIEDALRIEATSSGIPETDLATTLMAAAVETTSGKCLCFHLGDGLMLHQTKNLDWAITSYPENGLPKNETYLTMNSSLDKHLRFYRWRDVDIKKILLLTDGAENQLKPLYYSSGHWVLPAENGDELCGVLTSALKNIPEEDDHTFGLISI